MKKYKAMKEINLELIDMEPQQGMINCVLEDENLEWSGVK